MKKRYDLHRKIRECLSEGSELSELMPVCDDPERCYLIGNEIDAARKWIANINSIPEGEILERMPKVVELIRECARAVDNHGFDFWAEEFESVAKSVEEALESELESANEEAKASN